MNPLEGLVVETSKKQRQEEPAHIEENFKSKTKLDEVTQAALNIFVGGREITT